MLNKNYSESFYSHKEDNAGSFSPLQKRRERMAKKNDLELTLKCEKVIIVMRTTFESDRSEDEESQGTMVQNSLISQH